MRGVARQKDAAALVALGQQQMREPGIGDQDLARKAAAGPGVEDRIRIDVVRIDAGRRTCLQGPGVLVVLRDQRALVGLVVPGDAEGLQQLARVGAEMDHVAVRHGGAAVERDAQPLAHAAGAAVAAGEEIASHLLGSAGLLAAQRDGDAGLVLLEILEGDAPARVDQRMIHDGVAQYRLDHHLAHPHGGLAWLGAVVAGKDFGALLGDAGIAEAVEFAASCFPWRAT